MNPGRTPPHDAAAERAVIGGVMLERSAFDEVSAIVAAADFYEQRHADLWVAIQAILGRGQGLDTVTLRAELVARNKLQSIGGDDYLLDLTNDIPTVANIAEHASLVQQAAHVRRMILAAHEIAGEGYGPPSDPRAYIDRSEARVLAVSQATARASTSAPVSKLIEDELVRMRNAATQGTGAIPTGFTDIDGWFGGGFWPKDMIIVAGRPGMGKTAFGLNVATNIARRVGPVGIFSLEMPKEQLIRRMLASEARVDSTKIRAGTLSADDWRKVQVAAQTIHSLPIEVDDDGALTPMNLRSRARRLAAKLGELAGVVLDYIQLMRPDERSGSREQDVSESSRACKGLAKELGCPVIVLAQLNRDLERRSGTDRRPRLADLRESGSLEQDSDSVLFVYRPAVYEESADPHAAEVIIAKQRSGPTGLLRLAYFGEYVRFDSLARDTYDGPYTAEEFQD